MKYALVFALVGLVLWYWRGQRLNRQSELKNRDKSAVDQRSTALGQTTEVVACSVCRLHLPRQEALLGRKGVYCSAAHKQTAGE